MNMTELSTNMIIVIKLIEKLEVVLRLCQIMWLQFMNMILIII